MIHTAAFQPRKSANHQHVCSVASRTERNNIWTMVVLAVLVVGLASPGWSREHGRSATLTTSSSQLSFGSVAVGANSTKSIRITNSGWTSAQISSVAISGAGFQTSTISVPMNLRPGGSFQFSTTFTPSAAGNAYGTITISSNATDPSMAIGLTGTGLSSQSAGSPVLALSTASLSFGSVNVGTTTTQTITLSDSGSAALTISQAGVTGTGFTISALSTPLTLNAGQSASVSVSFDPLSAGSSTGTISISSNSIGSGSTVALSGTGVSLLLNATPASVSFGSVATGSSNSQTILLSNSGVVSATVSQALITGSGMSLSGLSIPLTIAAGKGASFNVVFSPAASGSIAGSLTLVSNAANSPLSLALSGTGASSTYQLSVSPSSLSFGNVTVGSSSQLSISLTNTGNANVSISTVGISGTGFTLASSASAVTLTPSQSASVTVQFTPAAAGSDTGTVTVTSTATGSPASVPLSGSGVQAVQHSAALSWTPSTSTVAGYNIYRSLQSNANFAIVNTSLILGTTFTDTSVAGGQTYYYVATSVDSSGNQSGDSNVATANVPTQ